MKHAHYLRFARSLALAAVVPGCTSAGPAPAPEPRVVAQADAPPSADAGTGTADADHDREVDAELPFSSGPIVPPELPASLA